MSLISYLIILISTLFVFKNQRYLILIFSFTASTSDALISSDILLIITYSDISTLQTPVFQLMDFISV